MLEWSFYDRLVTVGFEKSAGFLLRFFPGGLN